MAKMKEIELADLSKVRIATETQKDIAKMYESISKDIAKEIKSLPSKVASSTSESVRRSYLNALKKQIDAELDKTTRQISSVTKNSIRATSSAVVQGNNQFMERAGLKMTGAFSHVPNEVVQSLVSGNLYKNDWTYSKAIWGANAKTSRDLESIVARGIASQSSTYDIAKDLEKYVSPSAKKDWAWSKVYPGTSKTVDYNAQRLARTMIQHSYQQSFRQVINKNPFVMGVIWHSAFAHGRSCYECMERDGEWYEKGKEPLDHANGLCFLEADIPQTMEEIADELATWARGGSNPGLTEYYHDAMRRDAVPELTPRKSNQIDVSRVDERENVPPKI